MLTTHSFAPLCVRCTPSFHPRARMNNNVLGDDFMTISRVILLLFYVHCMFFFGWISAFSYLGAHFSGVLRTVVGFVWYGYVSHKLN